MASLVVYYYGHFFIFLFVVATITFSISSSAQTSTTTNTVITLGSTIIAAHPPQSSWLSPSGDFSFGFHPLQETPRRFLLGIVFHKIPERNLVWSANRNDPAHLGSTLTLTLNGQLLLTHSNGTRFFIFNGTSLAGSALMQDDGNLVLLAGDNNSSTSSQVVVWQSFDSPTDTILLGQTLVTGQKLFSNSNGTVDYSVGNYMLEIQIDGNVVMSAYKFADPGYWYTLTAGNPNVSMVFNQTTGFIYVKDTNSNSTLYQITSRIPNPIQDYYHRATINDKGNLQQFVYNKRNGTASGWTVVWEPDFIAREPCLPFNICGVYGFCTSTNNRSVNCECLPGYSPWDPDVPSKGCYPDMVMDYCSPNSSSSSFTIESLDNADFPNGQFADMAMLTPMNAEQCKQAVLDDCYAAAGVLVESVCYKKRMPLLNARRSVPSTNNIVAFLRVPKQQQQVNNNETEDQNGKGDSSSSPSKLALILSILLCTVMASLFATVAIYHHPLAQHHFQRNQEETTKRCVEINLKPFSFQEIQQGTNGFRNKLGKGAYGTVYGGVLTLEDDHQVEVAVKLLDQNDEMEIRGEKEFLTEVQVIALTHHKNLVGLLGFCNENKHRALVYELMEKGSLASHLFDQERRPDWNQRADIAIGVASGLVYLHEECETQIIHCDIKPQNVLLDQDCIAKIADFGLAKLLMKDQTRTSTMARGTMGYMAPEWLKNAPVTTKVDVYSFGVMLLEILFCRKHMELQFVDDDNGEGVILIDWVLSCVKADKLQRMVEEEDPETYDDFGRYERMVMVGLWCTVPNPNSRPTMKKVLGLLEGFGEIHTPALFEAHML